MNLEATEKINQIINEIGNSKNNLITILQAIQNEFNYISPEIISKIAEKLEMKPTEIFGVVTFYKHFKLTPPGKNIIKICHGTACHINSAIEITEEFKRQLNININETTKDGLFSLEKVACLGCCSLAPAIMINEKVYGKLTTKKIKKILDEYRKTNE
ncbi:MAG TPA: NADH-quinone oxidoreductase subunit NuoE [bacterium]|nr:NADH-quinone oxidoreductase subunit NuoE [bacterium]HOL47079.1 NADH-quinone oxidoreductase subunit NuoE [bacterium]HPQ18979.1 NADH-quinone oxidoreductase subunit NuoE [bacterium]